MCRSMGNTSVHAYHVDMATRRDPVDTCRHICRHSILLLPSLFIQPCSRLRQQVMGPLQRSSSAVASLHPFDLLYPFISHFTLSLSFSPLSLLSLPLSRVTSLFLSLLLLLLFVAMSDTSADSHSEREHSVYRLEGSSNYATWSCNA